MISLPLALPSFDRSACSSRAGRHACSRSRMERRSHIKLGWPAFLVEKGAAVFFFRFAGFVYVRSFSFVRLSWSPVDLIPSLTSPSLPPPAAPPLLASSPLLSTSLQIDQLKQFRQWGSMTPGHPENFETKGVEVTTGELMLFSFFLPCSCSSCLQPGPPD